MKIEVNFRYLKVLADRLNPGEVDFSLSTDFQYEPLDIILSSEGIELDLKEIITEFNLLSFKGRQVLLYIKDHSGRVDETLADPEKGKRFHIAYCETLETMRTNNRFERYVATNQFSDIFKIVDESENSISRSVDAKLMVCKNCLKKLNYKNVLQHKRVPKDFWHAFALPEFFSAYSSCFAYMPKAWTDNVRFGYTDDWKEVSERVRREAGYVCTDCGIDLSGHKSLCHVHHVNGVKSDNSSKNLQVVCIDCHRRKPLHQGMFVRHKDMQTITALRRKSNKLADFSGWDEVWSLSDPAVHGDLGIMKSKGYGPPVIGYEIQNERHEVIGEVEVAWPERRIGICINQFSIPGWQMYRVGDVCGS